ncbi:hypothetical protein [Nonlabens spongiae]|uniref:hypothetical protein n=1 Tax=Nonlabens spongiae TaxID=331648 RepID=UPI001B806B9B|nr:hypothetical protein [Nonlabens spongiae]
MIIKKVLQKVKSTLQRYIWILALPIFIYSWIEYDKRKTDIRVNREITYGKVNSSSSIYKKYSKRSYNYSFLYQGKRYDGTSSAYTSDDIKYQMFYKVEFSSKNPSHNQMIFDTAFVQVIRNQDHLDTIYMPYEEYLKNISRYKLSKQQMNQDWDQSDTRAVDIDSLKVLMNRN